MNTLSAAIEPCSSRFGRLGQLHQVGGVVLDPLPPFQERIAIEAREGFIGIDIVNHPPLGEAERRDWGSRFETRIEGNSVPGSSPRVDLDEEETRVNRRLEPALRVNPGDPCRADGEIALEGVFENIPCNGGLTKQCDARRFDCQFLDQLEPNRLGEVEVGATGFGVEPAFTLDVRLGRQVLAIERAEFRVCDPRGIPDHQDRAVGGPVEIATEVGFEKIR